MKWRSMKTVRDSYGLKWFTIEWENGERSVELHNSVPRDCRPYGANAIAWAPIDEPTPYTGTLEDLDAEWAAEQEREEAKGRHLSPALFAEYGRLDAAWQELVREREEARRDLAAMTKRAVEAEASYRFMVERAADERLDGYRELGARVAAAEDRAEKAERDVAEYSRAIGEIEAIVGIRGTVPLLGTVNAVRVLRAKLTEAARDLESSRQVEVCSKAFHDLVVKERNFERVRADRLEEERDAARADLAAMTERAEKAKADLADCAASVAHVGESPVMDGGLAENVPASVGLALQRMKERAETTERERDEDRKALGEVSSLLAHATDRLAEAERDRDEARAEVAEKRAAEAERECAEAWDVQGMAVARAEKAEAKLAEAERERDTANAHMHIAGTRADNAERREKRWRTVAESRPDISREESHRIAEAVGSYDVGPRIMAALRAHAAGSGKGGDDG